MEEPLVKAIEIMGSQSALATAISKACSKKIWQSNVSSWLRHNQKGVPAEFCSAIEKVTKGKVRKEQLRPDIFGRTNA